MSVGNGIRRVDLPWAAWYQDAIHTLAFPSRWQIDVLEPDDAPGWSKQQIESALDEPVESPPLAELARGGRTACVVVDDLTRPTKAGDVLPKLLDQLRKGGIQRRATSIVAATGTHGPLDRQQIEWKVGPEVASSYRIEVHDVASSPAPTGIQYGQRELKINRTFLQSDIKVGIGSVLPHSFAGYGGGAKLALPGLADTEATARSHKFVEMGLRGGRDPNQNRFRLEIERLARKIGFRYVVCIVPNRRRETAGCFAGDLVTAHRRACTLAGRIYATPLHATYDCVVLNAYPKDIDLIQADSALVSLKTATAPVVHENGIILIATAATQGLGRHGLFAPGGVSYRAARPKRALGKRDIWLYAPNVTESEARQLYWKGYPFFQDARALTDTLSKRFPDKARVGVLPCAPIQQLDDRRENV